MLFFGQFIMILKENEQVIKVLHHHYTALFFRELKVVILSVPFFFIAYLLSFAVEFQVSLIVFSAIALIFAAVMLYDGLLYHLDRLIITNMRILYIDWKNPFSRSEHEAELNDIQDIETKETGILSFLPFFDYGDFILETASAHTIIKFNQAPDPEGIKHFIYHINRKPNRIGSAENINLANDRAPKAAEEPEEEVAISRT